MKTIDISVNGIVYNNYYFIENAIDYKEYLKILDSNFDLAEYEIKQRAKLLEDAKYVGHASSALCSLAEMFSVNTNSKEDCSSILARNSILKMRVVSEQIKCLTEGKKLLINSKGGYFPLCKNDDYNIISNNKIIYSAKDIKISKWPNGKHYYAKIRDIDVVDSSGDMKWNTELKANQVAMFFLRELNSKS